MSTILSITTDRKEGGIATALVSYSRALGMRGHHHILLLPSGAVARASLSSLPNVTLVTLSPAMIRFHLLTGGMFHNSVRAAINRADTLFIHNAGLAPLSRRCGKTVCLISHSGKLRHLDAADHAIFLSRAAEGRARELAEEGKCGTARLHIIPHGFPTCEPLPPTDSTDGRIRVMAAGRFVPKKGFETLLEAARILKEQGSGTRIDLYGDGPLKPVLVDMINRFGLDNVTLHGWAPTLDRAFAEADIFCLPSLEEPFGLVIGEAMGRGLPVVATCTDGPLDVLGPRGTGRDQTLPSGGILTDPGDAAGLAEAIDSLATSHSLRATTGKAARKRIVTDFGMESLADRLDALIVTASRPPEAAR